MKTVLTILICLFSPAMVLASEIPPEEWRVDRKEMTEPLSPSQSVHVTNPYGDIRVRSHHKPEAYILVNAQRHRDDPLRFEVDICEGNETLHIRAFVEPFEDEVPEAFRKRRMDMTVFLPGSTNLQLETSSGFTESRGLAGDLAVTSEWGQRSNTACRSG